MALFRRNKKITPAHPIQFPPEILATFGRPKWQDVTPNDIRIAARMAECHECERTS